MEENNAGYTQEALHCLPREELRRMLTEELRKGREADDRLVRLLLRELECRGSDPKFRDDEAVEAACEKFRQETEAASRPRKRRWLKAASVVLVLVLTLAILFFALPSGAEAKGIQGMLSWWSDSVFQFFTPGEQPNTQEYVYTTDNPELQRLYDEVAKSGITEPVVPRWVPEGLVLDYLDTYNLSSDLTIFAHMEREEHFVSFSYALHSEKMALKLEKDEQNIKLWELGGREHKVLSNNGEYTVTWFADTVECTIVTDCPEEDVYRMIKSIYTSED